MVAEGGRHQTKLIRAKALKKPLALCPVCQLDTLLIQLGSEQPLNRCLSRTKPC